VDEPIRIQGKYDAPRVRDGLIVCVFKQLPFTQWAESVERAFDQWLEAVPKGAAAFATVGNASSGKPVNPRLLTACRAQLDRKKAASRETSGFEIGGPQPLNPDYQFAVWGGTDSKRKAGNPYTNFVELHLPTEGLDASGDDFAALACRFAETLGFDSGYASLALHWSIDGELNDASKDMVPLAMRHPGFDMHSNLVTSFQLGRRSRGARWLTFLGSEQVEELGGKAALAKKCGSKVEISELGDGLALRVSGAPKRGDVNRKQRLAGEEAVARAIEPVTFFGDEELGRHVFGRKQDARERWERRFLD